MKNERFSYGSINRIVQVKHPLYSNIYDWVKQVPRGKVTTYGQIARMIGCTARQVGWAMAACNDESVPWHRVINSQGKISPRCGGHGAEIQKTLLEAENIVFDDNDKIDLARYLYFYAIK